MTGIQHHANSATLQQEVFLLWMKAARNHARVWEEHRTVNNDRGTYREISAALELAAKAVGYSSSNPPSMAALWTVSVSDQQSALKRYATIVPASDSAVLLLELEEELLAFEEFERTYVPVSP